MQCYRTDPTVNEIIYIDREIDANVVIAVAIVVFERLRECKESQIYKYCTVITDDTHINLSSLDFKDKNVHIRGSKVYSNTVYSKKRVFYFSLLMRLILQPCLTVYSYLLVGLKI